MNNQSSNTYTSAFFIIPSYIAYLPGMTLNFLKIYETIFQFWNHNKACYLSEKSLMERTKVCRTQIYDALTYFEKHGEIKRVRKGMKRYLVRPQKVIETDCTDLDPMSGIAEVSTNNNQTSDIADLNVRDSGRNTSGIADYNNKNINKEINTTSEETSPISNKAGSAITEEEIIAAYHEVLSESPKIKVIDNKLRGQLRAMQKRWPTYSESKSKFTLELFKSYLEFLKSNYQWALQAYMTENGNRRINNIRTFTNDKFICKIVNNEFTNREWY